MSHASRLANALCLAAAPTYATLAVLTGFQDDAATLCGSAPSFPGPLSGMTMMYLLMSAFHAAPWLRLIAGRRRF